MNILQLIYDINNNTTNTKPHKPISIKIIHAKNFSKLLANHIYYYKKRDNTPEPSKLYLKNVRFNIKKLLSFIILT